MLAKQKPGHMDLEAKKKMLEEPCLALSMSLHSHS
jgi:hypothetical protein